MQSRGGGVLNVLFIVAYYYKRLMDRTASSIDQMNSEYFS